LQSEVSDPLLNNPLAQAEDSAWTKYFELRQLQKDITIDLERLNPDDEYFRQVAPKSPYVRKILPKYASFVTQCSGTQGVSVDTVHIMDEFFIC